MSEQISANMALKIYNIVCRNINPYYGGADGFFDRLRDAGLLQKSKLDEARAWCRRVRVNENLPVSYREAVEDTEGYFEAAISEILEERN